MAAIVKAVEEQVEEKLEDGSRRVRLHKPIRAFDKTMQEVTFREPTAKDVIEIGNPVEIGTDRHGKATIEFDKEIGTQMMARLANIPVASIVNQMSVGDWLNCKWAISNFFVPPGEPEATST